VRDSCCLMCVQCHADECMRGHGMVLKHSRGQSLDISICAHLNVFICLLYPVNLEVQLYSQSASAANECCLERLDRFIGS